MQTSNWHAAAKDGRYEYKPISVTPLEPAYQRSTSSTKSDFFYKMQRANAGPAMSRVAPASNWVASRTAAPPKKDAGGAFGASIVLGSDPAEIKTSSTTYGASQRIPTPEIDLLERVSTLRDSTLDGAHRASMTEKHFLQARRADSSHQGHGSSHALHPLPRPHPILTLPPSSLYLPSSSWPAFSDLLRIPSPCPPHSFPTSCFHTPSCLPRPPSRFSPNPLLCLRPPSSYNSTLRLPNATLAVERWRPREFSPCRFSE